MAGFMLDGIGLRWMRASNYQSNQENRIWMTLNHHEKFAGSIRTCVAQRKQNRSTENRTLTPKRVQLL